MLNEIYKSIVSGNSKTSDELAKELGISRDMIAAGLENLEKANLIERVALSKNTKCNKSSCKSCSQYSGYCSTAKIVMWKRK